MSTALALMTIDEFLVLPNDGVRREFIRGVLREYPAKREDFPGLEVPSPMRNRKHSTIEALVTRRLGDWNADRPGPRGEVACGEAGCVLRRDPDTGVGVEVAYFSPEAVAATPNDAPYYEGPPTLAVEILSPSNTQAGIDEKVALYLDAGTLIAWVLNARFRTVIVHRPGVEPVLYNALQELSAEPHLPGFRVAVADLFEG